MSSSPQRSRSPRRNPKPNPRLLSEADKAAKNFLAGKQNGDAGSFERALAAWQRALNEAGWHSQLGHTIRKNMANGNFRLACLAGPGGAAAGPRYRYHLDEVARLLAPGDLLSSDLVQKFLAIVSDEVSAFDDKVSVLRGLRSRLLQKITQRRASNDLALEIVWRLARRAALVLEEVEADSTGFSASLKDCGAQLVRARQLAEAAAQLVGEIVHEQKDDIEFCSPRADGVTLLSTSAVQPEGSTSVLHDVRFAHQRALALQQLAKALRAAASATINAEEFDMELCKEVLDEFREAVHVSQKHSGAPGVLTELGKNKSADQMDVEVSAVCVHHLAEFMGVLGMDIQSTKQHLECVRLGASLDTEADVGALISRTSTVKGVLATKSWFKASLRNLQKKDREKKRQAEKTREANRKRIQKPLKSIQQANRGREALVEYLYQTFPPAARGENASGGGGGRAAGGGSGSSSRGRKKRDFLEVIREFHPDKQVGRAPDGWLPDDWQMLCGEISKMLNHYYEVEFCGGTA